MDYLEIMNFCGFDLKKAHEMAKQYRGKSFSEIIKEEQARERSASDVHTLQPKSCQV